MTGNNSFIIALQAVFAYYAGMKTIQYTIRGVPERFDQVARKEAMANHQSLNTTLVKALERGLGVAGDTVRHNDLDDLVGSWVKDPEFDRAMLAMDKVDEALWK
jgi:hypothetical protein